MRKIFNFKFLILNFFLLLIIVTFYTLHSGLSVQAAGSNCPTPAGVLPPLAVGLISVWNTATGKYDTPSGICAFDKKVRIPDVSYNELKSIYYTQSKSTDKKNPTTSLGQPFSGDGLHNITQSVTINSSLSGSGTQVIFIDGSLTIDNTNITYGGSSSGLVFVARDGININSNVFIVNAVLITGGVIRTAGSGCTANSIQANPLVVNGSLISLSAGNPIVFCRKQADNTTTASEVINSQAKYLVILKDLFAKGMTITIEDTSL